MGDYILMTGDQVIFEPTFGNATVTVAPGVLAGSGPATIGKMPICVDGDEAKVTVPGCAYIAGNYSIPGVGMLFIDKLAGDQLAKKTNTGGKAVMLKGSKFDAKFTVVAPAQQPSAPNPIPDTTLQYKGKGSFETTNSTVMGS